LRKSTPEFSKSKIHFLISPNGLTVTKINSGKQ
jgi:hypothetical protein